MHTSKYYSPIKQTQYSRMPKTSYVPQDYQYNAVQSYKENTYSNIRSYDKENHNNWNTIQTDLQNYGYRRKLAERQSLARSPLSKRQYKNEQNSYQCYSRQENYNQNQEKKVGRNLYEEENDSSLIQSLNLYGNTRDSFLAKSRKKIQKNSIKTTPVKNYSPLAQQPTQNVISSINYYPQRKYQKHTPKRQTQNESQQNKYDKYFMKKRQPFQKNQYQIQKLPDSIKYTESNKYSQNNKYPQSNKCSQNKHFQRNKLNTSNKNHDQDEVLSKTAMLKNRIQQLNHKTPRKSTEVKPVQNKNCFDFSPLNSTKYNNFDDECQPSLYQGSKYSFELKERQDHNEKYYYQRNEQRYLLQQKQQKENLYKYQNKNWQYEKSNNIKEVLETLQQCNESQADKNQGLDKIAYLSSKINQRLQNMLRDHEVNVHKNK